MFSDTIALTDGTTARDFSTISVVDQKTVRRVSAEGLNNPRILTISTQSTRNGTHRHAVRLDKTAEYNADGDQHRTSVYIVIENPVTAPSQDEVDWQIEALCNFMTTAGNVEKILNGES